MVALLRLTISFHMESIFTGDRTQKSASESDLEPKTKKFAHPPSKSGVNLPKIPKTGSLNRIAIGPCGLWRRLGQKPVPEPENMQIFPPLKVNRFEN